MKLYILKLNTTPSPGRMDAALREALSGIAQTVPDAEVCWIPAVEAFKQLAGTGQLQGSRLIIAAELDASGINLQAYELLRYLQDPDTPDILRDAAGGVIIDGRSELYTKDLGRRITFAANRKGCAFPGKPLVEATEHLQNFRTLAQIFGNDLFVAYAEAIQSMAEAVLIFRMPHSDCPRILVVHASNRETSNSLQLWELTSEQMTGSAVIEEISIRNGEIVDCRGCRYETCVHFGERGDCVYGGVMSEKVYPAIITCDILVLVCPNYNDAISANIMALINRLTAVFRTNNFSRKKIYAIVVSGYSGGDIVAQQIIGAINMNKNFILPPHFALIETANQSGEAMELEGIRERALSFAQRILDRK